MPRTATSVEVLHQHNIAALIIDLCDQDSPPIGRKCQARPTHNLLSKLADSPDSSRIEAKELEESTRCGTIIHKLDTLCVHSPVPVQFGGVIWVIDIHD